jgi:hypothetical protein
MYKISVGCVFRNEAHCIKEWLDHYLHHGVDHFYLINDNSTDDYLSIITPYMKFITLYHDQKSYYLGRQRDMYNEHILPNIKNTKWLLIVDMDEFVWSPIDINLNNILNTCNHLGQIQIQDVLFGSNAHILQPDSIVNSFTMRENSPRKCLKYFVNSEYEFSALNIHHATFKDIINEKTKFMLVDHHYFIVNHYSCQSKDFWIKVKCTRGDGDNYKTRTIDDFVALDKNEVEDLRLKIQNENIKQLF